MSAKIFGLKVNQPKFLSQENSATNKDLLQKLQDIALAHETQLDIFSSEGNEAKTFIENSSKFDLAVVGKDNSSGWQSKKISEFVALNSSSTVLYIPN